MLDEGGQGGPPFFIWFSYWRRWAELTENPYSAKLPHEEATLIGLRDKHGDKLESWWKEAFGYGFEFLTESEARYLERADEAQLIRDRLFAVRQTDDY